MEQNIRDNGTMTRKMETVKEMFEFFIFLLNLIMFFVTLIIVICTTGVVSWPNGSRYEGNWKDDMKDGHGNKMRNKLFYYFLLLLLNN